MADRVGPSVSGPGPAKQTARKSDFASWGLGCLLGLIIFLVFSALGVFGFAVVIDKGHAGSWSVSLVSLFALIGFIVGSIVFLSITAPGTSVRGMGPIPTISISPGRAGKGLQNLGVVKTFLGLIVCISIYLIFTTLILFTSDNVGALSEILFFVGLVLGPIMAIFIARRTSMS